MQCKQKLCVRVLGIEVLFLRFSASGWADVPIILLLFLSLIVASVALLWVWLKQLHSDRWFLRTVFLSPVKSSF
jgi:hypothetical protein